MYKTLLLLFSHVKMTEEIIQRWEVGFTAHTFRRLKCRCLGAGLWLGEGEGAQRASAWPLNAQVIPEKTKFRRGVRSLGGGHYFAQPVCNHYPGLISCVRPAGCRPQTITTREDPNQAEERN